MHLVTYNQKYSSFNDAARQSDGLAVFGFFAEVGVKRDQNMYTGHLYWSLE
jgi:hypothetical protein